jgi:SecD/SecF fusion protein
MQGKGLITIVAIVLGLICLNELLPTWYASKIEKQIEAAKETRKRSNESRKILLILGIQNFIIQKLKTRK